MTKRLVRATRAALWLAGSILAACGGGGGPPPAYTIGGTVAGLNAAGLELANGAMTVAVAAGATTFAFAQALPNGTEYEVTVSAQPSGEICHVINGTGSINGHAVTSIAASCGVPTLAPLAGNFGGAGNADGSGPVARFDLQNVTTHFGLLTGFDTVSLATGAVAADGSGNLYIADAGNHTIRMVTAAGAVTTLAGTPGQAGSADGSGSAARFNDPTSLAIDAAGNIFVADSGNNTIRKITPAGVVSTFAGTAGTTGSADGTGAAASFNLIHNYIVPTLYPSAEGYGGVATDNAGNVYVADCGNSIVRKISPAAVVTTVAGQAGVPGSVDTLPGQPNSAQFGCPHGLATDGAGNIDVADGMFTVFPQIVGAYAVRRISPAGVVTTMASVSASGLVTDNLGNIYVAGGDTIDVIAPAGSVTTLAGTPGAAGSVDGVGGTARFNAAASVAIDAAGDLFVADSGNNAIRKITSGAAVTTLAGAAALSGSSDGAGAAASFSNPVGLATDASGNVYVADQNNQTLVGNGSIRKITPAGVVTTLTDMVGPNPWNVAADSAGNLYVVAAVSNTIQKVTPAGMTSTFAGAAAAFAFELQPLLVGESRTYGGAVATDGAGNVYVADTFNNTLRKITPTGNVSMLAGTTGAAGSADGTGAAARFYYPQGIAADSSADVYVADTGNNTIRKITPAGVVTTLAGTAGIAGSADGTGPAASFNRPTGLAVDGAGNIYVADTDNDTVRKITPQGVVTTVVGAAGMSGFAAGPLPGVISHPLGIAISGASLYLTSENGVAVVNYLP
jgi:sugar lactone lactonase YvrE